MPPRLLAALILGLLALSAPIACADGRGAERAHRARPGALADGWQMLEVAVGPTTRTLLWKGPERWSRGAILVLHGGGGTAVDWCHAMPTRVPAIDESLRAQADFSRLAVAGGFAVFALDATSDQVVDAAGQPCGKRFDALVVEGRENVDLPFIAAVIGPVLASLRPAGSSRSLFLVGESTGGAMAVRAAARFSGLISAAAPAAACDPYGCDADAGVDTGREARGVLIDRGSGRRITEPGAAGDGPPYAGERAWESPPAPARPPVLVLHHADDGIVDRSCHRRLMHQLAANSFPAEALVLPGDGRRSALAHLWQRAYNRPVLDFLARHARPADP
jgi:poly(3-hydroxybutyrate) depolymerase